MAQRYLALFVLVGAVAATIDLSPLQKVIKLLGEMKTQVESDGAEDDRAYAKYSCWCKTNEIEKVAAIDEAGRRIDDLHAFLAESVAKEGQLKTEIEGLIADLQEDQLALEQATALRDEERKAFEAANAETLETLDALKKAIDVLSQVQFAQKSGDSQALAKASALVQVSIKAVQRRATQFQDVMQKDLFEVLGSLQSDTPSLSSAFLSQPSLGGVSGAKSYNSQSGSIFGVLVEMKDQFERDLKSSQEAESKAAEQFERMAQAKKEEMAAASQQQKLKETELAELMTKTATAKRDIENLEKAKAADEAFLAELRESCAKEADEYKQRTDARSEEIRALGEALDILTEDDARALFGKTMSFLQVSSGSSSIARNRASQVLIELGQSHRSRMLVALAASAKRDSFAKVKEAMDKMVAELTNQQKEDTEKVEFCKQEIDKTEDVIRDHENVKKDLDAGLLKTENDLAVIKQDMKKLQDDISAMQVALKQAGEIRKEENKAFQDAIADQRSAINILRKAQTRLEAFYGQASLMQIRAHRFANEEEPPKPSTVARYSKHGSAGGVLQVFRVIIADAEKMEQQVEASEQKAQNEYASFVKKSSESIQADEAALSQKMADEAATEAHQSELKESELANDQMLATQVELLQAHHVDCDWLLKYYSVRQEARTAEIDAIKNAKAILSGANFTDVAQ